MATRDEFEPLQGALAQALGGVAERGAPAALHAVWTATAGAQAAGASRPQSYRQGTLVVEADTAAWLHALQLQESELRHRLGRALPGFRALELRLKWGSR